MCSFSQLKSGSNLQIYPVCFCVVVAEILEHVSPGVKGFEDDEGRHFTLALWVSSTCRQRKLLEMSGCAWNTWLQLIWPLENGYAGSAEEQELVNQNKRFVTSGRKNISANHGLRKFLIGGALKPATPTLPWLWPSSAIWPIPGRLW